MAAEILYRLGLAPATWLFCRMSRGVAYLPVSPASCDNHARIWVPVQHLEIG